LRRVPRPLEPRCNTPATAAHHALIRSGTEPVAASSPESQSPRVLGFRSTLRQGAPTLSTTVAIPRPRRPVMHPIVVELSRLPRADQNLKTPVVAQCN
jgi:hypothetical protein